MSMPPLDPEQYKRMPEAGGSLGGTTEHIAEVGVAEVGVADDGVNDWGIADAD